MKLKSNIFLILLIFYFIILIFLNNYYREIVYNQFDEEIDPAYKNQYVQLILNDQSRTVTQAMNIVTEKKTSSINNNNVNLFGDIADFSNTRNNPVSISNSGK